ncbi:MAG: hypothetical protein O2923_08490 [Verrucomicrobia bacterium]|nr:hypothetical protein [Verrucomicrobiota bacterium]MDA1087015.1 hypothetical protein [Verrucomicrobiota bacterium]
MRKTLIAAVIMSAIGLATPECSDAGGSWYVSSGHRGNSYGISYSSGSHRSHESYGHHTPSGRYEYRTQKVWVPGGWHYSTDACGRTSRHYLNSHYEHQTVKVWVPYHSNRQACGCNNRSHHRH